MIRTARPDDAIAILELIRELARYEGALDEVVADEELIRDSLFRSDPSVFCYVVEHEGEIGGFALWYLNYSARHGRHGIYLDDLYIRPELRNEGYGHALLRELARLAFERGYCHVEWETLDWNEPAIHFYRSAGAKPVTGTLYRLSGADLQALAGS